MRDLLQITIAEFDAASERFHKRETEHLGRAVELAHLLNESQQFQEWIGTTLGTLRLHPREQGELLCALFCVALEIGFELGQIEGATRGLTA